MPSLDDYLYAFFSPNVGINDEGKFVKQDGYFDNVKGSRDYASPEDIELIFKPFYNSDSSTWEEISNSIADPNTNYSISSLDYNDTIPEMYDKIINAAQTQNDSSQTSADKAMQFSADQAEINRQFQKELYEDNWKRQMEASNTSYQRAMEDLKAAGLNPKLVSKIGGSTTPSVSTPSGSSASGQSAQMSVANLAPLANILSSYITGADALDRNQNDFVQKTLSSLIGILPYLMAG